MTGSGLPHPPSTEEIVELVLQLAVEAPAVLPAFLWSLCRSTRAAKAFRTWRPSGAHLAMLQSYPIGKKLIGSSRDGAQWLHNWTATSAALDVLLPPLAPIGAQEDGSDEDERSRIFST